MMSGKSLVFPVNNKGGVGKTSLSVDLVTILSVDYNVGVIDMDNQGTLYGTFTGDYTLGNQDTSAYSALETRIVELHGGARFNFAQGSKRMKIRVHPGIAPVALFPVGMIEDYPESVRHLHSIVNRDMSLADIILVDLPPVPHPKTILKQTLMPAIEALEKVDLFPLIVTTPEKNTIDIGLRGYALIHSYLISQGVPEHRIHPIVVINKVSIGTNQGRLVFGSIDENDRAKLRDLKIIYDASTQYPGCQYFDFRRRFKFNGRVYRVVWMPFIEGLRGGDFNLFKGKELQLFNLPRLYDQVRDGGYDTSSHPTNDVQRAYSEQMDDLCSFIRKYSSRHAKRNYSVNKNYRPKADARSTLVRQIRTGLQDVYQIWDSGTPITQTNCLYSIGDIRIRHRPNSDLSLWIPEAQIPLEPLARAIAKAETDLGLTSWDSGWKAGDVDKILTGLRSKDHYSAYENELLNITADPGGHNIMYINLKFNDFRDLNPKRQLDYFHTFLAHLDTELSRKAK